MPRKRSKKGSRPFREANQPTNNGRPQLESHSTNKTTTTKPQTTDAARVKDTKNLQVVLGTENYDPNLPNVSELTSDTAELYNELDSFRLKWKREIEGSKNTEPAPCSSGTGKAKSKTQTANASSDKTLDDSGLVSHFAGNKISSSWKEGDYAKARKLFLTAVELEQDDMHYESIQYYKQAMHLCPDIEKQIFHEQRLASTLDPSINQQLDQRSQDPITEQHETPLLERIKEKHLIEAQNSGCLHCRPQNKIKTGTWHISDLPHELMIHILRYVVGQELDLASLEIMGMVCRGFFILSRDAFLWRSICYQAWGPETRAPIEPDSDVDWRQMFLERPRVNYDGVYISRTKYIRQGDVGFQDLTYRPFHVVRYYRYLRFFPDGRVLILTTNEEPDKIIPIFRHALHRKQFSSELSIMEGKYEFLNSNQISIIAEKDLRSFLANPQPSRRHELAHWSRQTPHVQKFILKFNLDTITSKPYRNNVLKWLEYTILARFDTGQEVTSFDLTPDSFPNLNFARVKRFNLRLTDPLPSH